MQLEALGIPSMLIVTEPFLPIVASFAPTVGMAGYPATVTVPHPVSSLDDTELKKLASAVIDSAVAALTV